MKGHRIVRVARFILFAAVAAAVFSFFVMKLWNWLLPAIFGLRLIGYWQAVGLLILSKLLFGVWRGGPRPGMHWRRRMMERWEQMTPEEREKFRAGMQGRCGPFGPAGTETKAT
jgi:hypothetical protein